MSASTVPHTAEQSKEGSLHVHVRRLLRAKRERVFDAWTRPEQMREWMGPAGWSVPEARADVRPGGEYRVTMRGTAPGAPGETPQERTGTARGVYLEVVPPELIRYTWIADWAPGEESMVTVRLSEAEGGTLLEVIHEHFETTGSAQGHESGWKGALDKLETFLEQQG